MKEKKTIEQQVAELTLEQKKNIKKYELIETCFALVIFVPLLILVLNSFFAFRNAHREYMDAMDDYYSFSVLDEGYDDAKEIYQNARAAYEEAKSVSFKTYIIVFGVCAAMIVIVWCVVLPIVKKKMPYFSVKKAAYLLTHKIK